MTTEDLQEIKNLLQEVQGSPKEVLTSDEAAAYLGISKSCLYKLTMGRKIPHYKSEGGKLCYFDRAELIEWMKAHKVATQEELEAKAKEIVRKKGGRK
ncbi:MAG: helix-turn-helix domain-containing protein [Prevotella sp.]|nr:helix-turn-helix domain-containing protein [Prevotella sp.]